MRRGGQHPTLRVIAGVAAAAIALTASPWSLGAGLTVAFGDDEDNDSTTSTPVKHIVVIFQENVSFDHYFATYPFAANPSGEPKFFAKRGTPSVNGLTSPGLLTENPNSTQPFRLDRSQASTCDQDHDYGDEQRAFDMGLMDKFPETVGAGCSPSYGKGTGLVMGYFDGNTTTAIWNYAQHFAMSDNSYNTTFGPSTPGALNLISGQTHGSTPTACFVATDDPTNTCQASCPAGKTCFIEAIAGTVVSDPQPTGDACTSRDHVQMTTGKNVGDLLNAKGVTWGFFQGGFDLTLTNPDGSTGCKRTHTSTVTNVKKVDYIPHHQPFQYYASTANPSHKRPTSVAMIGKQDQANHQYDLHDFFDALANGNMPSVSYLKAAGYQDGHAGYSDPLDEQTFLVNTLNTLQKSPEWNDTAVIIAYDDSDGWYDHVMGPIAKQSNTSEDALSSPGHCGTAKSAVDQGRCGYGPRLPLLVVSPFAKVNYVDHTVSDQSSILQLIEDNWNLGRIGGGSYDDIAGSLLGMFDFKNEGEGRKLFLDPSTGLVTHSEGGDNNDQ
jgi:phospholipase C